MSDAVTYIIIASIACEAGLPCKHWRFILRLWCCCIARILVLLLVLVLYVYGDGLLVRGHGRWWDIIPHSWPLSRRDAVDRHRSRLDDVRHTTGDRGIDNCVHCTTSTVIPAVGVAYVWWPARSIPTFPVYGADVSGEIAATVCVVVTELTLVGFGTGRGFDGLDGKILNHLVFLRTLKIQTKHIKHQFSKNIFRDFLQSLNS